MAGYKFYYKKSSSQSDEFDGTDADQGPSPIILPLESLSDPEHPSFTLTGLDDQTRYTFAVTAYDNEIPELESDYSLPVSSAAAEPISTVTNPVNGTHTNSILSVAGTSAETLAPVQRILLQVTDGTKYLASDNTWGTTENWIEIENEDLSSWTYNVDTVNFEDSTSYDIKARAVDVNGYQQLEDSQSTFTFDQSPPTCTVELIGQDISHIAAGPLEITVSCSESLLPDPQITIQSRVVGVFGPFPLNGSENLWRYTFDVPTPPVDGLFMIIVSNVWDLAGNRIRRYPMAFFTTDTLDSDGDGLRDFEDEDDDNDGLTDVWENMYGLDPLSSEWPDGTDGDFDDDGYTNFAEYIAGTNPADHTSIPNSPMQLIETLPLDGSGTMQPGRVPPEASVAVHLSDADGIDLTDPFSVQFTVNDGFNPVYQHNLESTSVRVVKINDDADVSATDLWVVYDRSRDIYGGYGYDSIVQVTIDAQDARQQTMAQIGITFRIETETEYTQTQEAIGLLETAELVADDPYLEDATYYFDAGSRMVGGPMTGTAVIYHQGDPLTPFFGLTENIPDLDLHDHTAVGGKIYIQPNTVFSTPLKVLIPVDAGEDLNSIRIYRHNGQEWFAACDVDGGVLPKGTGWMVPGSRINHQDGSAAFIEIKIYHSGAIQLGIAAGVN